MLVLLSFIFWDSLIASSNLVQHLPSMCYITIQKKKKMLYIMF